MLYASLGVKMLYYNGRKLCMETGWPTFNAFHENPVLQQYDEFPMSYISFKQAEFPLSHTCQVKMDILLQ